MVSNICVSVVVAGCSVVGSVDCPVVGCAVVGAGCSVVSDTTIVCVVGDSGSVTGLLVMDSVVVASVVTAVGSSTNNAVHTHDKHRM